MENVYRKSKGNAGLKGVQFQLDLVTMCLLNAFHNHTNWKISTENQNAAKYDDIVIELPRGTAVLIQAKHKEHRKITKEQLLSDNAKNSDFSLPKYFFSYEEIKTKFRARTVIICTNTHINPKGLEKVLTYQRTSTDSLLYHDSDNCSFCTLNENILPDLKKSAEIYLDKHLQGKGFDKDVITDENLKDFLNNLQIFSCYPCENELHKIIEKLLYHLSFSTLWNKIPAQEILRKVEEWFKQPKGEYLTEIRTRAMISEIRSERYCESFKDYDVSFNSDNFNISDLKQTTLVKVEGATWLHMLKLFYALQGDKHRKLFVNPDDDIEMQKGVVEAFVQPRYSYLIIAWSKIKDDTTRHEISVILKEILERHLYKRVILVVEGNNNLDLQVEFKDVCQIERSITFEDLSKYSQDKLLTNNNVIFQGKRICLEELLYTQTTEDYKQSLDSAMLEKLIRREDIEVGARVSELDADVAPYYIHRTFERYIHNTGKEKIPEEKLYDVDGKIILISDCAGMGKSTVLTKVAVEIKEKHSHLWIIRINLNDHTRILRECLRKNRKTINVIQLLNSHEATKLTNQFETLTFSMKGKVVLMLDGIDEISPDYTGLILALLCQCQTSSNFVKIFITTRPHVALELEAVLNINSFKMLPFTTSNQVDFLINFWVHNLQLNHQSKRKCEHYAKTLLDKMSSWIYSNGYWSNAFTAVPLQVRMLAEIFQDDILEWQDTDSEFSEENQHKPKLLEKFNIARLYGRFIEKKRDVFVDKGNPSGSAMANPALLNQFEGCLACHRSLALKVILNYAESDLFVNCHSSDSAMEEYVLKIGLVQKFGNKFQFIHRTFAEYFVAECIVRELQLQNQNFHFERFLIDDVFVDERFDVVCAFVDVLMEKAFLSPNVFECYKTFNCDTDLNLIFQLARKGNITILRLILKSIHFTIIRNKEINVQELPVKTMVNKRNTLNALRVFMSIAGINIRNEHGETPLHFAVRESHLEMVTFLVEQGANINLRDNDGSTVLHLAATKNNSTITTYLVENNANVNARNNYGHTALHSARYKLNLVKYLVKNNANMNLWDNEGNTALHLAARDNCVDTVKYLMQHGAIVNFKNNEGFTALHLAARWDHCNIVQYLVQHGADLNVRNYKGHTPLHLAAAKPYMDIVRYLVEQGADINVKDNKGCTALHLAAEMGETVAVRYLVEHHADLNVRDCEGRTVLHLVAIWRHLKSVKYLTAYGADVNNRNSAGDTVLHLVVKLCDWNAVKYLATCRADVNIRDGAGRSALHLVTRLGRLDFIKHLVKCGADLNLKDNEGCTALHCAVICNNLRTVEYLVDHGIDIGVRNNKNQTALHLAVELGLKEIVTCLVEHCDDCSIRDSEGHKALRFVSKWSYLNNYQYLLVQDSYSDGRDYGLRTNTYLLAANYCTNTIRHHLESGDSITIVDSTSN